MLKSILFSFLLLNFIILNGQSTKPVYQKGKLDEILLNTYIARGGQGEVLAGVTIDSSGKLTRLGIIESTSQVHASSALAALSQLDPNSWLPAYELNQPVQKDMWIGFVIRELSGSTPADYPKMAKNAVAKGKYEKALKNWDRAIEQNPFKFSYYEFRSDIKAKLGDPEGSKADLEKSILLQDKI